MTEKPWNAPLHPGEFFAEDFLQPLGMSDEAAADALQIPLSQLQSFLREATPVTADLALRLSQAFGCGADYWLALQNRYDLEIARGSGVPKLPRVPGLPAAA